MFVYFSRERLGKYSNHSYSYILVRNRSGSGKAGRENEFVITGYRERNITIGRISGTEYHDREHVDYNRESVT
jgi:hypothetical protein